MLEQSITQIFENRKTKLVYPIAFEQKFYNSPETRKRWAVFLSSIRQEPVELREVINEIARDLRPLFTIQRD